MPTGEEENGGGGRDIGAVGAEPAVEKKRESGCKDGRGLWLLQCFWQWLFW